VLFCSRENHKQRIIKTLIKTCRSQWQGSQRCSSAAAGLLAIAVSNHNDRMFAYILWILCAVRQRPLWRADHSSREELPHVVCLSVVDKSWCCGGLGPCSVMGHRRKNKTFVYAKTLISSLSQNTHNMAEYCLLLAPLTRWKAEGRKDNRCGKQCRLQLWEVSTFYDKVHGCVFWTRFLANTVRHHVTCCILNTVFGEHCSTSRHVLYFEQGFWWTQFDITSRAVGYNTPVTVSCKTTAYSYAKSIDSHFFPSVRYRVIQKTNHWLN
jgi:hypothetical protein